MNNQSQASIRRGTKIPGSSRQSPLVSPIGEKRTRQPAAFRRLPTPQPGDESPGVRNKTNWFSRFRRAFQHGDRPWQGLLIVIAALVIALMAAIGWMLWKESSGARITFGLNFLMPTSNASWDPVNDKFQTWPFIYGTLLTSLFAIVIALPISLGIAIFLAEICPSWLRTPLTWLVELLAAIPSVVYGLWGIFIFLPNVVTPVGNFLAETLGNVPLVGSLFAGPMSASGASRLGASLILTIMITPTIAAVTRDVFLAIPASQREASQALGATKWETIWQVLVPYGLSGILGAVILGLGRALGETMAVTMVIGNSIEGSPSLLRPGYTMASVIANEFAEAVSKLHTQALVEVGLVLFVMTLLLNIIARFLVWRVARRTPQEARA
jgi:phosphate transport system permease protein